MCQKTLKFSLSPSTIKMGKITLLLAFFCFAECAAGACIRYGHSCWGAHGKRSGGENRGSSTANAGSNSRTTNELIKNYDIFRNSDDDGGLFYSRLIEQIPRLYKGRRDIDVDSDLKMKNLQLDDGDLQDLLIPETNDNLHEYNQREKAFDKIRFLNYLKTNAEKLN